MFYIAIPIYSDPFLHPQHKNNKLSLLYVCECDYKQKKWTDRKSYILPQKHPDSKVPPFFPPIILNPLPSSIFFLTLSLGSGETSLASTGLYLSAWHEAKNGSMIKIII